MNTLTFMISFVISAVSSIGFTAAFFIAYRHTRLTGFRLLFLTSAAGLALWLVQTATTPMLLRVVSPQVAADYILGFHYVSLTISATQIAAIVVLARQYYLFNHPNPTPANV